MNAGGYTEVFMRAYPRLWRMMVLAAFAAGKQTKQNSGRVSGQSGMDQTNRSGVP